MTEFSCFGYARADYGIWSVERAPAPWDLGVGVSVGFSAGQAGGLVATLWVVFSIPKQMVVSLTYIMKKASYKLGTAPIQGLERPFER